jgi:hypothetical protein
MSRLINNSDRFINVYGNPLSFLERIIRVIDDLENRKRILVVGNYKPLLEEIYCLRPDLVGESPKPKPDWLAWLMPKQVNGIDVPFSLNNKERVEHLKALIYGHDKRLYDGEAEQTHEEKFAGKIGVIVLNNQQGKTECAPDLLREFPDLIIYNHMDCEDGQEEGMEPADWDYAIPPSVDVNAEEHEEQQSELPQIPEIAMYGKCHQIAKQTCAPKGYAYVDAIACTSVLLENGDCNFRPNVYVSKIGPVRSGKSLSGERTRQLVGLADERGNENDLVVTTTPVSDRGIEKLFDVGGASRLLALDEARGLMAKGNIQNNALISTLCALWSRNREGAADKFGIHNFNVRLSMSLNFKVKDEAEFPEIFTHATAHGLYDRMLFGVRGAEKWRWSPWDFLSERDVFALEPSKPAVEGWVYQETHHWAAANEDRDRLAEMALRVAYITSAVNGDGQITHEALEAALRLMDWQEVIRARFQPAEGSDDFECLAKEIKRAFKRQPGQAAKWRDLSRKYHWSEHHCNLQVRRSLLENGELGFDKKSKKYYLIDTPAK